MFQKGDHMVVLAALIILAVVGGIFVNYLRRNQNDIGGGMGKDYILCPGIFYTTIVTIQNH